MITLVGMSARAGLLILAIMLLRALARSRLPKASFLILWGFALLRMQIPVSFPLRRGLLRVLSAGTGSGIRGSHGAKNEAARILNELVLQQTAAAGRQSPGAVFPAAAVVWLIGISVLLLLCAIWLRKGCSVLRFAVPLDQNAVVDEWRAAHRMRRPLRILQSDRITTPLAIGIMRPCIILPKALSLSNRQTVRYILTHEYCHIRRFDMLWKVLALCTVCVHWFNPLAWVMLVLLNRDLEITCDELVLRRLGADAEEKKAYAYSLIEMAETRGRLSLFSSHFSRNAVEERITAMMKHKKAAGLTAIAAAVMVMCLTMAFTALDRNDAPAPEVYIPAQAEIRENGYPVNQNGETFGPNVPDLLFTPDLELAINEDGVVGYIRENETRGARISSPEEAAAYVPEDHYINMYAEDGQTIVGQFWVKG